MRAGLFQTLVGQFQEIRERGVGQGEGGGVRHGGGHVRDAVVEHAIDEINGIGMGGGVGGFEAAALIDGDIHDHCAALHVGDHIAADEFGSGSAGDEHRADDQVGTF